MLVPWWLTRWQADHTHAWSPVTTAAGVVLVLAGSLTTASVFVEFVRADGTPVPGAMPQRLVVTGLNRHVRNPIYLGALTIFIGETLLLLRWSMVTFTLCAWVAAVAFVRWYEQPALRRRFGSGYDAYIRDVPAWLPQPRRARRHTRHDRRLPENRAQFEEPDRS